jgi:maleamate amidohydrolase
MKIVWDDVLGAEDREIIERGGYGRTRGLGVRPALVIIDCQYNHIGADKPILHQLDEWPAGAGERGWSIVRRIQPVLEAARRTGLPVIYTRYCHSERGARFDSFAKKRGRDLSAFVDGAPGTRIVAELAPADGELVIDKVHASAFYGTALLSYLIGLQVDSLLVTGVSTSGCVRATAVEAASLNYNVVVLADCVTDRILISHKASLLDLWMKYADVLDAEAASAYLEGLPVSDETAAVLTARGA